MWSRKKENQVSLEPEEDRQREAGTGREKTREMWNLKRQYRGFCQK
jgi:hypothetical protein